LDDIDIDFFETGFIESLPAGGGPARPS